MLHPAYKHQVGLLGTAPGKEGDATPKRARAPALRPNLLCACVWRSTCCALAGGPAVHQAVEVPHRHCFLLARHPGPGAGGRTDAALLSVWPGASLNALLQHPPVHCRWRRPPRAHARRSATPSAWCCLPTPSCWCGTSARSCCCWPSRLAPACLPASSHSAWCRPGAAQQRPKALFCAHRRPSCNLVRAMLLAGCWLV